MENKDNRRSIFFAAIDPYIETNIVAPTESKSGANGWIVWGDGNRYPEYLLDLSKTVSTLRSVITGTVDFIAGDDVTITAQLGGRPQGSMNKTGCTIREQVREVALDYETYGGFALQVIRSYTGEVVELYHIDMRYLRSNKDNTVFWYCEKWCEGRKNVIEYPAFYPFTPEAWAQLDEKERNRHASSIYYVKNTTSQVYPLPVYAAAVKACETERCIDDYHLNAINNGFVGSAMVNFNNGVPSDEIKEEITDDFTQKYGGHQNAMRIVFCFNDSRDNATTIVPFKTDDFGSKYEALSKHVRQQIFTAFRANPNLFGIPTESLGFSSEEYDSAFKLYNRTMVRPVQRTIAEAYERILGLPQVVTIKPFSLETETETNVN